MTLVLPVIHHKTQALSLEQAALVFSCGADGLFVISHHNQDRDVVETAALIKAQYPDKAVGINLLSHSGMDALKLAITAALDMVWDDAPGVTSGHTSEHASTMVEILKKRPAINFFGSVAFKYQPHEPEPGVAAVKAYSLGMIPTTSGSGTGVAPEIGKIAEMRRALNGSSGAERRPLAIASGMTVENIEHFLPYLTHILVATGVSLDEYRFCPDKLRAFTQKVKRFTQALSV